MPTPDSTVDSAAWCEVDHCPASICAGPHVEYVNDAGDTLIVNHDQDVSQSWGGPWRLKEPKP